MLRLAVLVAAFFAEIRRFGAAPRRRGFRHALSIIRRRAA
jgi:hypothetical protein